MYILLHVAHEYLSPFMLRLECFGLVTVSVTLRICQKRTLKHTKVVIVKFLIHVRM